MISARHRVVAEQLQLLSEPLEFDRASQALHRIALAALPDWGEFEVPRWLVDGLRPIVSRLFELSDPLKVDLLECLAHLYESPAGVRPDFDLREMEGKLATLPASALPYALSIIARAGREGAEQHIKPYVNHPSRDVRSEARVALESLAGKRAEGREPSLPYSQASFTRG